MAEISGAEGGEGMGIPATIYSRSSVNFIFRGTPRMNIHRSHTWIGNFTDPDSSMT